METERQEDVTNSFDSSLLNDGFSEPSEPINDKKPGTKEEFEIIETPDDEPKEEEEIVSEEHREEPQQNDKSAKLRDKAKTRINQIQREKYQALNELEKIRMENEQLKGMVSASSNSAIKQYEDRVIAAVERARQQKIDAIESGDPQAQADADIQLSMATNEMHTINNWKADQELQQQRQLYAQKPEPEQPPYADNLPFLGEWIQRNPWFNPESDEYDEELAENIQQYTVNLNNYLSKNGVAYTIMSPKYFQEVDKQVKGYVDWRNSQNPKGRDLQMKHARGGAVPSRGGYASQQGPRQVTITASEKEMARRMGVSEQEYIRYREKDKSENAHRRGGR
jgi:hypothetical protein